MNRLREGLSAPGADPRSWVLVARVDDADDAIRWDAALGWLVDVTITGGELDGEGPIACRVLSPFGAPGQGSFCPVARAQPVALVVPEGNPNIGPLIVGTLPALDDAEVPTSVVGESIDDALAKASFLIRSSADFLAEYGDLWHVKASDTATLEAPNVRLADPAADQAFVRGDDQKQAFDTFLVALNLWATQVAAGIPTNTPPASQPQFVEAITQLGTDLGAALSSKIKGE